jgi:hypothetical protein
MALIASQSNAFVNPDSRLQLKTCVEYLWLPVFIVWLLNLFFLLLHYRLSQYRSKQTPPEHVSTNVDIVEQSQEQEQPSILVTTSIAKLPRFTERFRLRELGKTGGEILSMSLRTKPLMINRSVSDASFPNFDQPINEYEDSFQPSQSRLFKIILFTLLIVLIALLFVSNTKIYFDIGI